MAGNIGLLRNHMAGMIGGNTNQMMSSRIPSIKMGKSMTIPKKPTKVKKQKTLSTVRKAVSGATTLKTPTIGGY